MKELKKQMIKNAKAYNKNLTDEYLEKMNFSELLAFCHPEEREIFMHERRQICG